MSPVKGSSGHPVETLAVVRRGGGDAQQGRWAARRGRALSRMQAKPLVPWPSPHLQRVGHEEVAGDVRAAADAHVGAHARAAACAQPHARPGDGAPNEVMPLAPSPTPAPAPQGSPANRMGAGKLDAAGTALRSATLGRACVRQGERGRGRSHQCRRAPLVGEVRAYKRVRERDTERQRDRERKGPSAHRCRRAPIA